MVLQILRKKTRSIFIYVAFAIIILVFVFYFGWGGMGEKPEIWVAKINDRDLSRDEYLTYYNQLVEYYQRMYKTTFDKTMVEKLGIKQEALDNLIKNRLLLEAAHQLKLNISDMELKDSIESTPAFQNEGRFDVQRYTQILKQNRLTPEEFESALKKDLMGSRISAFVQDGTKHVEREPWEQFVWENEKINLEFIEIDPEEIVLKNDISAEEIKEFYNKHKEEFRVPEKIKIRYLEFDPQHLEKQITVSPEEISQYYADFSEEFWEPAKVHARHILIKADPGAQEPGRAEAKKKAEEILAKIKKGEPFGELAQKYSQDQATAEAGGDLGFFARGQMVQAFEDAAFALKPGEVSEAVETRFGFHILRVDAVSEEGTRPLEAVKEQIRATLVDERTKELVKKEASRAYRMALKSQTLEEYANKHELKILETEYFAKGEDHPLFGGSEELLDTLFSTDSGELLYPFARNDNYYVIKIEDKRPSFIASLEEAEEKILSVLQKERQKAAARTKGEAMLKNLKEGSSLKEIAEKENLSIKETKLFSRSSGSIPSIGDASALMIAAFSLSSDRPYPEEVFEVNDKICLVKLKEREGVPEEEFKAKEKEQAKRYRLQKAGTYLDAWLETIRSQTTIEMNPRAMTL